MCKKKLISSKCFGVSVFFIVCLCCFMRNEVYIKYTRHYSYAKFGTFFMGHLVFMWCFLLFVDAQGQRIDRNHWNCFHCEPGFEGLKTCKKFFTHIYSEFICWCVGLIWGEVLHVKSQQSRWVWASESLSLMLVSYIHTTVISSLYHSITSFTADLGNLGLKQEKPC